MRIITHLAMIAVVASVGACGEVVGPGSGAGPSLDSVEPAHGPLGGGIQVTATGGGLNVDGQAVVLVGGVLATDVTVVDDSTVTFVLPAGIQGGTAVDVTVSTQDGFDTLPAAITYSNLATVISVDPPFARQSGGSTVTIIGRGFTDADAGDTHVLAGDVEATSVTIVDDQTITATIAAAPDVIPFDPRDLVVANANGDARLEGGIRFTAQGLLMTERRGDAKNRILYVQPATGTVREIARAASGIHGCTLSPGNAVFAVQKDIAQGTHVLVTLNPLTGQTAAIGVLRNASAQPRHISSLVFNGTTLYGYSREDSKIATIDPATAIVTVIGPAVFGNRIGSLAVRDATSFYWIGGLFEASFVVDTAGNAVAGPSPGEPCCAYGHGGAMVVDGTLYVGEYLGQRRLMTMDPTTGAMTAVVDLEMNPTGMCKTPSSF